MGLGLTPLLMCILKLSINSLPFLLNRIILMASFWGRLSMERAQQEVLIKQTLCANLNTYVFCLILLMQRAEPSH